MRPTHVVPWMGAMVGWMIAAMAGAQTGPPQTALAESLFEEGQALMQEGRVAAACEKLAESFRLEPATGTVLNLAVCHEKQGRIATAWAEFRDAKVQAMRDQRPDRVELAQEHIELLEPALPRLTVRLGPGTRPEGLIVELDGVMVGSAAWGAELPLDPGAHKLVATAPGHARWEAAFSIAVGEHQSVEVPALAAEGGREAPARVLLPARDRPGKSSVETDPYRGRRTTGYLLGAGGLAALGVGSWFGVEAVIHRKNSDAKCNPVCTDQAVELNDEAKRDARIADVGIGLGLVGIVAGAYVILTTPESRTTASGRGVSCTVEPILAPQAASLSLSGRW